MKVALVHYWLVRMRGGEKILEGLCEMFPEADVFTHVYEPSRISPTIRAHNVKTTFIARLPLASRIYQHYLPLMPLALEQLDLRRYDLVISIESGPAKGVLTGPNTTHVCICCTPMRYLWDKYQDYLGSSSAVVRSLMRPLTHYLRVWDLASASRVDHFVSISDHVRKRVQKFYRRESVVVVPPVDTESFAPGEERADFYLVVGQLVTYKRVDLAVRACTILDRPLVVIGEGEELRSLRRIAGPTVRFLGWQPFESIKWHYRHCRALLFPGEEDFGIVPLEAMASGRPVIALGKGGALETVVDGKTGLFFKAETEQDLVAAIRRFETGEDAFTSEACVAQAASFAKARFQERMRAFLWSIGVLGPQGNADGVAWPTVANGISGPIRTGTAARS